MKFRIRKSQISSLVKIGYFEMKVFLIVLAAYFNTHRMIEEYAEKAYKLKRQRPWAYSE